MSFGLAVGIDGNTVVVSAHLDDDNGIINDGTPHFLDIDSAFRAQGFPGRTATFKGLLALERSS